MVRLARLLLPLVLALAAGTAAPAATIAVLAPEGAEAALDDWSALKAHLERRLPDVPFTVTSHDLAGLRRVVAEGRADFIIVNSGLYVELEAAHGASRIATLDDPLAPSPEKALASAIVVRADRMELRGVADLQGQRVRGVEAGAFGGWQLVWRELQRAGVDVDRELAELQFTGFPMRDIVAAVQRGEADAGVVRRCLLETLVERGAVRAGELRVLAPQAGVEERCERSTPLYPNWPFAVLRHTPRDLAKRVATALLDMPRDAAGHAWAVPVDYQPVHELFRELRIGPYAYLRQQTIEGFVQKYRAWLIAAALLLAGAVVHVLRVEGLVMRRTRELREALQARERAEGEARSQREKLDHLARLSILGEMSSMLAHEMNQPLAAIGNYALGMGRRIEARQADPQPLLQASREIATQAERAGEIMQRIRAFARKRDDVREPVALGAVIESSLALYSGLGPHTRAARGEVAEGARVRADRLQVEQVLLNLLKNAHDAVQALPADRRQVAVSVERVADAWRVAVCDNGPPLDRETRERLFEPFFTTKPAGLGLGLAICRTAIESHGGRLWARANDPADGLTVGFDLPAFDEQPAA